MQKEEKDCFLQSPAYALSELILIVFDKKIKEKERQQEAPPPTSS